MTRRPWQPSKLPSRMPAPRDLPARRQPAPANADTLRRASVVTTATAVAAAIAAAEAIDTGAADAATVDYMATRLAEDGTTRFTEDDVRRRIE